MEPTHSSKTDESETLLSLKDLSRVLKKRRKTIGITALIFSSLFVYWNLTKPVQYEVDGTFREKGKLHDNLNPSSMASLLLSGNGNSSKNQSESIIKSNTFLSPLIERMGLQAKIAPSGFFFPKLLAIKENLLTEWGLWGKKQTLLLNDIHSDLIISQVHFDQETPASYTLNFTDSSVFEIKNTNGESIGVGELDKPFVSRHLQFILTGKAASKKYNLSFTPMQKIVRQMVNEIAVEPGKLDPSLITLSWRHRDRHLAANFLNQLMLSYKDWLENEHNAFSTKQITYLKKRQQEAGENLEQIMGNYAETLSREVSTIGFPNTEKAIDFLAAWQQKCKDKLLAIDLETKRLTKAYRENNPLIAQTDGDPGGIIQTLLAQVRNLKLESNSLELALANSPLANPAKEQVRFQKQTQNLRSLQTQLSDIQLVKDSILEKKPLPQDLSLLENEKYLASSWLKDLQSNDENEEMKGQFLHYIEHLQHFFELQQNSLRDKLSHRDNENDFEGVKLQTASDLYISYSKNLLDIQTRILQLQHTLDHFEEPDFEISSLGIVLSDEVSRGLINRASDLILASREESNRTAKEQERMRRDLTNQQKFLKMHVSQTIDLLKLQQELWKEKIYSLQNTTLNLVRQQISLLNQQLSDHLAGRLGQMEQEKELVSLHQREIQQEMAKLPKKWMAEKVIDQYVKMNERIVEEITRLVESKNISSNLEIIQSAPLDLAVVPLQPKSPRLILMALLGAFLGAFLSAAFFLGQAIAQGLAASRESLALKGAFVAGTLPRNSSGRKAIETADICRTLLTRLKPDIPTLLVKGHGPNLAADLLHNLAKRGERGLLLSLSFDTGSAPGLLQYLEGMSQEPPIEKGVFWDKIEAGGMTQYGVELIASKKFADLLENLTKKYRWIFAVTPAGPRTIEALSILPHFQQIIVELSDEKLDELNIYLKSDKLISYVFIE